MAGSHFGYVLYIRSTTAKVWRALIDPEQTRRYWADTWQDCEWKPGAAWRIVVPDGRTADSGRIVEIEPERRMVISWRNELQAALRDEGYSRAVYELEQQGDMVRLAVKHTMDRPDSKFIKAVAEGWPMILSSLKSLLETGESLEATRRWPEGM